MGPGHCGGPGRGEQRKRSGAGQRCCCTIAEGREPRELRAKAFAAQENAAACPLPAGLPPGGPLGSL